MKRTTRNLILFMIPMSATLLVARDTGSAVISGSIIDFLANYSLFPWEKDMLGRELTSYEKQFFAISIPLSLPFMIATIFDLNKHRDDVDRLIIKAAANGYSSMRFDDKRWIVVSKYLGFGVALYTMRACTILIMTSVSNDPDTQLIAQIIGPFVILFFSLISLSVITLGVSRIFVTYPADSQ